MLLLEDAKSRISLLDYIMNAGLSPRQIGNKWVVNPCPVCGRKDHFYVYPDTNSYSSFSGCCKGGSIIDFMVEVEKKDKRSAIKEIVGSELPATNIHAPVVTKSINRLPDKELNSTHQKMLKILTLAPHHKQHLINRGISEYEIKYFGYRTMPEYEDRNILLSQLTPSEMEGVPGFGLKYGRWIIAGQPGLLIPRVFRNLTVSFALRLDKKPKKGGKYRTLSSAWMDGGTSPGARLHVATPPSIQNDFLWITEGDIKANIAACRLKAKFISVPGIGNWKPLTEIKIPQRIIVIAYDNEKEERIKAIVKKHQTILASHFANNGHFVYIADWQKVKGIDDALIAGEQIRLRKYK